ncbi:MAG TPA: hypothetical protein VFI92_14740 [Steroidobacteraceae bacterium]|nr:hypothetical protein [Steroidobacteraceae bacterium]
MTMTIRNYALPGLLALVFLAACSPKQPQPVATPAVDDADEETVGSPAQPRPKPPTDYAGQATGMLSLLADAPECQSYRDELQAIAQTPAGAKPAKEPSRVVAEAHKAGCSKSARGE